MEALLYHSTSQEKKQSLQNSRTRPRLCSKLIDVIVLVGGKANNQDIARMTVCYEPEFNKWYSLPLTR